MFENNTTFIDFYANAIFLQKPYEHISHQAVNIPFNPLRQLKCKFSFINDIYTYTYLRNILYLNLFLIEKCHDPYCPMSYIHLKPKAKETRINKLPPKINNGPFNLIFKLASTNLVKSNNALVGKKEDTGDQVGKHSKEITV